MPITNPLPRIEAVRHTGGLRVWLRFTDGLEGELDLSDGLDGSLLAPLRDPAFFARVRIAHGALEWPNGADWSPEVLHERLRERTGYDPQRDDDARRARRAHLRAMHEISRFFGIVIRMLASEHAPPHFHADYGEFEVSITIRDGVVTGRFPTRALRLVLEWSDLHKAELLENWDRLQRGEAAQPIAPLD